MRLSPPSWRAPIRTHSVLLWPSTRALLAAVALVVFLPAMALAPGAHAMQSLPVAAATDLSETAGKAIAAAAAIAVDAAAVAQPPSEPPTQRCDRQATRMTGAPACREAAFAYFRAKGLSRAQAAGIVGNLWLESSGVSPKSRQFGGGPGRGIAQWTVDQRWQGVLALARSRGVEPETLDVQLDYLWHELNSSYKRAFAALKSARTVRDATLAFQNKFEVPVGTNIGGAPFDFNAHHDAHTADRISYARQVRDAAASRWGVPDRGR